MSDSSSSSSPFNPKDFLIFTASGAISILLYIFSDSNIVMGSADMTALTRSVLMLVALYYFFEKLFKMELHTKIILGMVLGGLAGFVFQQEIAELKPVGTAFIRMIQMIVVPLVLASLITGTASLGDIGKMKRIGTKTLAYYLMSTALAISVGLLLANIFQPGSGMDETVRAELLASYSEQAGSKVDNAENRTSTVDTFLDMIPSNPITALAGIKSVNGQPAMRSTMLQVIFFSIFMGIALTLIPGEKAKPVIDFFDGLNDVMIKIVVMVIEIAPYGVFALIADAVGNFGIDILLSLIKYTIVTAAGLMIMVFLYPFVVKAFTGRNPIEFLKNIRPAQLIAFSTSSSGATLPVTMEVCEDNVGVSKEISSFVLPLGATVNMDGTALYQGVATLFIAQVYGIPLDLSDQLVIVLTATLASIGTAAAPGVGILMLVIVLQQVGIPAEGIALILAVDRILDMFRTTVNVTSDATCATVIASMEGQLHRPENVHQEF